MKKRKKKGFTLVELIVVIAIVAIATAIASVVFISVRNKTLQKSFENVKSYIETKAALYANDTGVTRVTVETLIKNGYARADDDLGKIKNPKDNTSLNCYFVNTKMVDGNYESTLTEEHEEKADGSCADYTETSDLYLFANIGGTWKAFDDSWLKTDGQIKIGVSTNKDEYEPIQDELAIYSWHDNYGYTSADKEIVVDTNDQTEYSKTYQVTVVYKKVLDNNQEQKIEGRKQGVLKIDNKAPEIRRATIENENDWTNTDKKIESKIVDSGSGVKGVNLVNTTNNPKATCPTDSNKYLTTNYNSSTYSTKLDTGNYLLCAIDNTGNISKVDESAPAPNKITITKIDKEPIKCQLVVDSSKYKTTNGWYKEDVEVELNITKVGNSGVKRVGLNQNVNETYNQDYNGSLTKTMAVKHTTETNQNGVTYYGYVINNAGKPGKCNLVVKVDKSAPKITNFVVQSTKNYNSVNVKGTISATDTSGIAAYCITETNDSSKCRWKTTKEINYTIASASEGSGQSVSLYAFAKDILGNVTSQGILKTYKLYQSCSQKVANTTGEWSACSNVCGEGKQTRTISYKDSYLNTTCDNETEEQACTSTTGCNYYGYPAGAVCWQCAMEQNAKAWYQPGSDQAALHNSNENIAQQYCPTCNYNANTGVWTYANGTPVFGGKN